MTQLLPSHVPAELQRLRGLYRENEAMVAAYEQQIARSKEAIGKEEEYMRLSSGSMLRLLTELLPKSSNRFGHYDVYLRPHFDLGVRFEWILEIPLRDPARFKTNFANILVYGMLKDEFSVPRLGRGPTFHLMFRLDPKGGQSPGECFYSSPLFGGLGPPSVADLVEAIDFDKLFEKLQPSTAPAE